MIHDAWVALAEASGTEVTEPQSRLIVLSARSKQAHAIKNPPLCHRLAATVSSTSKLVVGKFDAIVS
jgi:hypothetical protein